MPLESNKNMKKISVIIAGRHQTSISLEEPFWEEFQLIARINNQSINQLVTKIDAEKNVDNLSSAIRIFVLEFLKKRANS